MLLKTSMNGSELENGREILELIDVTEEYGALYGLTVPESSFAKIESSRTDRDEIERLAFYDDIKGKEYVAQIDEYLLTCVKNKG